jgi:hypothetical protein
MNPSSCLFLQSMTKFVPMKIAIGTQAFLLADSKEFADVPDWVMPSKSGCQLGGVLGIFKICS